MCWAMWDIHAFLNDTQGDLYNKQFHLSDRLKDFLESWSHYDSSLPRQLSHAPILPSSDVKLGKKA